MIFLTALKDCLEELTIEMMMKMLLAELTKDLVEETTAIDCPRSGGACYYLCSVTLTKMVVLLGQKDG